MPERPVITRFAPSPTGHLHVGGARTALFCWAYARRHAGSFILRIEDTDQARSSESASRGILEDLAWLGIGWDEGPGWGADREVANGESGRKFGGDPRGVGPFYQAERLAVYDEHVRRLVEQDKAYPAFDTPGELEAMRAAATARKETFRYVRAKDYDRAAMLDRARREPHVVRFRMPAAPIVVHDQVLGEVRFDPEHVDDFVIRKVDGFPTYHLAVVVDDELMGVTHVLRGQEHLNNTPRHVALQKAFGFRTPVYAHLPLIFNADGSKMSKRDKDKAARAHVTAEIERDRDRVYQRVAPAVERERFEAWLADKKSQLETRSLVELQRVFSLSLPEIDVDDFRRAGYLPEVLVNFLALLGWNPGMKNPDGTDLERFDAGFLAREFDLTRLGKSASKFDRAKLLAFNADTIQAMGDEEFAARWRAWAERDDRGLLEALSGERFAWAAAAVRPRCRTFRDARDVLAFAFIDDGAITYEEQAVAKNLTKRVEGEATGLELLPEIAAALERVEPFEPAAIDGAIEGFAAGRGLKMGRVAQPIRVAVTGGAVSPPLGLTLAVLGRERTLARLRRCPVLLKA